MTIGSNEFDWKPKFPWLQGLHPITYPTSRQNPLWQGRLGPRQAPDPSEPESVTGRYGWCNCCQWRRRLGHRWWQRRSGLRIDRRRKTLLWLSVFNEEYLAVGQLFRMDEGCAWDVGRGSE